MAIQSIERAAAILRALAGGSRRLGVSELADHLGLAKGTVHGLLQTLKDEGFVELGHAEPARSARERAQDRRRSLDRLDRHLVPEFVVIAERRSTM